MRETALGEIMSEVPGATTPNRWPESLKAVENEEPDPQKVFACPDCDRTFRNAQGLGAHRSRTHGYRKAGPAYQAAPAPTTTVEATIAAIFPQGIPVNREVLAAVLNFMEAHDHLVEMSRNGS